ncbi:MAG: hypothetical protein EAZ08_02645 [Cytophagales bacterium]|nr:MAG: hypothetical protein EAZ08_02645 [Cytophagales bacterium]
MKDLSEQELDDFFQKSLGKKQMPFNPKAWEKMEAKLEADKKKRLLYKRLLLLLPLLFITFGIAYFWERNVQHKLTVNQQWRGASKLSKEKQSASTEKKLLTDSTVLSIKNKQESNKEKQQDIKETNNGVAEMPNSNGRHIINNQLYTFNQLFSKSQQQSNTAKKLPPEQTNNINLHKKLIAIDSIATINKNLLVSHLDTPKKQEIQHSIANKQAPVGIRKQIPFGRLNIGLLLSPDWSSVGFQNIAQTGYKVGLGIEYQIARRLSISTGLIFSRLLYNTQSSEYTVPKGFWTNQIKPEKIWGACEALEVPINLHYALLANDRQKLFVSAGISSYWMLNEDYNFEYGAGMPTNLVKGWKSSKQSTYYFGIVNFSLGYAGKLTERSFWQIEPFVKLPLSSIGWGKVDLSSTGIFFSWKYLLVK